MRVLVLAVATLALLMPLPPAAAGCDALRVGLYLLVPIETPAGTYYFYYDHGCDPACHGPEWLLFEETNGERGLQYGAFFGHPREERCPGEPWDTVVA